MTGPVDLIACYWTLGGNYQFGDNDYSPWDFRVRVEAAAKAGYTGFGIKQADLRRTLENYSYADIRQIFSDNNIRHLELEALFDWCGDGAARARSDCDRRDLLAAAAELGAHHIKAVGDFGDATWSLEQMHREFQILARQARDVGTTAALEPIAFSNIPDLATAMAIIGSSAGHGGGVMLDSWHVTRGNMTFESIMQLPAGSIAGAELDDGTLETIGTPIEDTLNRRRLCGAGEFDLRGFIAAVRSAGYDGPWGVEIISEEQRARPLEDAAQLSYRSTMQLFQY